MKSHERRLPVAWLKGTHRILGCGALGLLLGATATSVAAPRERWGPKPFALRVRAPIPDVDAVPQFEAYAAVLGAPLSPWARWHAETALGGGPGGISGTFALDLMLGGLLVRRDESEGLVLRGGFDVYIDSLGGARITRFSLPQVELGYARYKKDHVVEVALTGGLVLSSRMRAGARLQRFPVAAQLGPRAMFQYRQLGARFDSGYLPLSSAPGGPALWSRAMLCYAPTVFAFCAEGSVVRIQPPASAPLAFGYAGLSIGVNFEPAWAPD